MSANMTYHFDKLRDTLDGTFESGRALSLAHTKLDEAQMWANKAERKSETNFATKPQLRESPYVDERHDVVNWFSKRDSTHPIQTTLGPVKSVEEYDELVEMAMND